MTFTTECDLGSVKVNQRGPFS